MLTSAAPLVKLVPDTTPEYQSCAQDIDQALAIFWTLIERLRNAADQEQPIHQVEEIIFRDVLTMGRALLRSFLAASGDGDVERIAQDREAGAEGPRLRRAPRGGEQGGDKPADRKRHREPGQARSPASLCDLIAHRHSP